MAHQTRVYPGFCSMKRLGVFLLPLGGMLVHCRVNTSIKFSSMYIHPCGEKHCESKVSCSGTQLKGSNRTARSRDERTNHQATMPPWPRKNIYLGNIGLVMTRKIWLVVCSCSPELGLVKSCVSTIPPYKLRETFATVRRRNLCTLRSWTFESICHSR